MGCGYDMAIAYSLVYHGLCSGRLGVVVGVQGVCGECSGSEGGAGGHRER